MRGKIKEKKTERLAIRVTKKEKAAIVEEARQAGLDISTYLVAKRKAKSIVQLADCRRLADEVYRLNIVLENMSIDTVSKSILNQLTGKGIRGISAVIQTIGNGDS